MIPFCIAFCVVSLLPNLTQAPSNKLQGSGASSPGDFGTSVALSNDTIVVGAISSGSAYVFTKSGSQWSEQQKLTVAIPTPGETFGRSVAISGDTIIVGAANYTNDNSSVRGSAYVFVRSGTNWSLQQRLEANDGLPGDDFGWSVGLFGNTAVIGAVNDDDPSGKVNVGSAYVFVRSGATWSLQQKLTAPDSGIADPNLTGDAFGSSVGIWDNTILVGAPWHDHGGVENSGAGYVFDRVGTTWSLSAEIRPSDTLIGKAFGMASAICNNKIVVGAYLDDICSLGLDVGSAYVFTKDGVTWNQEAKLTGSDVVSGDAFGRAVALFGDRVVVGAFTHKTNDAVESGAAYLYQRIGSGWTEQQKLTASDVSAGQMLGFAVAISDTITVIGAPAWSSFAAPSTAGSSYYFSNPTMVTGVSPFGIGTPGCCGTHNIGVVGTPTIGNASFALTCTYTPQIAVGLGLVTDSQDVVGSDLFGIGVLLHADISLASQVYAFDFMSNASGFGVAPAGIGNDPILVNKTFFAQAIWGWSSFQCNRCPSPCNTSPYCPQLQSQCWHSPYGLSSSPGMAITIQ